MSRTPPLPGTASTGSRPETPALSQVRTPPLIADYVTIRCIGQGSYGDVWLARNVLGTYFAAKIVYRDRFEEERPYEREFAGIKNFEPISRSHPGLMTILHVGRDDEKRYFYYVMELADDASRDPAKSKRDGQGNGLETLTEEPSQEASDFRQSQFRPDFAETYVPKTLAAVLRERGGLPVKECVQLGIVVAEALEHLHRHGLVHRDIKPSNIIFVGGRPKLADIGLVTTPGENRSLVGTPGFIAPEGSGTIGADLYSLGKVLYEVSTGKDRHHFPEPRSDLRGSQERDEWSELNEFLLRACESNPARRYAAAREMVVELELVASGRSLRRLHKLERRVRSLGRIGLAAGVVMLLGAAALVNEQRQNRRYALLADKLRHELSRSMVANGARLMDEGDFLSSLPWFAGAMRLDRDDPTRERMHRRRLEAVLDQCPKLVAMGVHSNRIIYAEFSGDGRRVVTASADGTARVWDAQTSEPITPPLRHEDEVEMAVFSPDGNRVVTASHDGTAQVWDAATGAAVGARLRQEKDLTHVAFSRDNRRVATASWAGAAQLWDAVTGIPLGVTMRHRSHVIMLNFSLDGRWVVTSSDDRTARVWNATNGEPVSPALEHSGGVRLATFSPDSSSLSTSATDGSIHLWNTTTWQPTVLPVAHSGFSRYMTFSKRGECLATSGGARGVTLTSGEVMLWRLPEMTLVAPPTRFSKPAQEIFFSPDERWVVCASSDATVRRLDAETGVMVGTLLRLHDSIRNVQLAPDGRRLLTSGLDGVWRIWDLANRGEPEFELFFTNALSVAEFSPDGKTLITVAETSGAMVWDARTGKPMIPGLAQLGPCRTASVSPDGRWLAVAQTGRVARVWSVLNRDSLPFRSEHSAEITALALTQDGSRLAVGGEDGVVTVWDVMRGTSVVGQLTHSHGVLALAFSADGNSLAVGCGERRQTGVGQAKVWRLDGPEPFSRILVSNGRVATLRFSHNGECLTTGVFAGVQRPGTAQIWDGITGRPLVPPFLHEDSITAAEFSPDDRLIATGGSEGTVRLWESATGQLSLPPLKHERGVNSLSFSPDGALIASGTGDGTIRVWDTHSGEPVEPAVRQAYIQRVQFSPDGRRLLIAGWDEPKSRARLTLKRISPGKRPAQALQRLATLWSAAQLDADGVMTPLSAEEVERIWREVKAHDPAEVSSSEPAIHYWHEHEARECEIADNWFGAIFHLRQLTQRRPDDPGLAARLRRAETQAREGARGK